MYMCVLLNVIRIIIKIIDFIWRPCERVYMSSICSSLFHYKSEVLSKIITILCMDIQPAELLNLFIPLPSP